MGGGERGRRNTGYWAPFNIWWRAHLQKHGERPKAEDLKRWFNEEARIAFPHEPPTYTMIRNHAKGLRDIASVKHYFRDYRARKRRAVADLAGEPSPRSEPDPEEEEEGESASGAGTASGTETGSTSDEEWKEEARKSAVARGRRRKHPQQPRAAALQEVKQEPDPIKAQPALQAEVQRQSEQRPPVSKQHPKQQAPRAQQCAPDFVGLDDSGDPTVTVTLTHHQQHPKGDGASCDVSLQHQHQPHPHDWPLLPSSRGGHRPSPLHLTSTTASGAAAASGSSLGGSPTHGNGAAAAPPPWASAWSSLGPGRQDSRGPACQPVPMGAGRDQLQPGGDGGSSGGGVIGGTASSLRADGQQAGSQPEGRPPGLHSTCSLATQYFTKLGEHRNHVAEMFIGCPMDHGSVPQVSMQKGQGAAAAGGWARGQAAVPTAAAAGHAVAATANGGPSQAAPPSAAATHLSPMSSQPVPPADAASTASTEAQRAARPPSDRPAGAGAASWSGSGAEAGAGPPAAVEAAEAAVPPAPAQEPEELYVGLHGMGSAVLEGTESLPLCTPVSRGPSMSAGGSQSQAWTPFAIPVPHIPEAEARVSTNTRALDPAAQELERGSSVGLYGLRTASESRGPVFPGGVGIGEVGLGRHGLPLHMQIERSPASAPCLDDGSMQGGAGGPQRTSWLQRTRHRYQYMQAADDHRGSVPLPGRGADLESPFAQQLPPGGIPTVPSGRGSVQYETTGVARQMSLPLLPYADQQQQAGTAGFGNFGASPTPPPAAPVSEPPQSSVASSGPPPVTTGFAPSKSAVRPGTVTSTGPAPAGAVAASSLQTTSPLAGPGPASAAVSGHVVLTGAFGPHQGLSGAPVDPLLSPLPSAVQEQQHHSHTHLGSVGTRPHSGGMLQGASPARPSPSGFAVRSGEQGLGAQGSPAWMPPQGSRLKTVALPPFPPAFGMPLHGGSGSPPAVSHGSSGASSAAPPAVAGALPGPAGAVGHAVARVRRIPYPHTGHHRMPPPSAWHPYGYPPIPGYPGANVRCVPGYPPPYMAYGFRRRFPSMTHPAAGPPPPPLHQQQQQPQQVPLLQMPHQHQMQTHQHQQLQQQQSGPAPRLATSGSVPGAVQSWPGSRAPQGLGAPWLTTTGGYEDANPPLLLEASSAPIPQTGNNGRYRAPEFQPLAPNGVVSGAPDAANGLSRGHLAYRAVAAAASGDPQATPPGTSAAETEIPAPGDDCLMDFWAMCASEDDALFGSGDLTAVGGAGNMGTSNGLGPADF